jgi:hypothetical protein
MKWREREMTKAPQTARALAWHPKLSLFSRL